MITVQLMKELLALNSLNQIRADRPHVDCVPCGGATKRSVLRGEERVPVDFHGAFYKVVNRAAKHGSAIQTPIFDSHLPGIEWALKAGFPVNNLEAILEGLR